MSESIKNSYVCLGHISAAHGIRGEVLIKSYTEPPENITTYGPLYNESCDTSYKISNYSVTSKGLVARFSGINTRNDAERLKGVQLYISRDTLPEDDEGDSWYHVDLIGCKAIENGHEIGEVIAVPNYGAGDLLEIKLFDTGKTILIPFTKECVPEVDISARETHIIRPAEWEGEEQS